jgi:hypothetical protein
MCDFLLERLPGEAVPFQPQLGFGLEELKVNAEDLGLALADPLQMLPARARVVEIITSGDERLPLDENLRPGENWHPITKIRLEKVRQEADARGRVDGLLFAFVSPDRAVLLDGTHRTVVAHERGQEYLQGWYMAQTSDL